MSSNDPGSTRNLDSFSFKFRIKYSYIGTEAENFYASIIRQLTAERHVGQLAGEGTRGS